ncbi:hypothetical protein IFM47457_07892 [Aspergillus lentulus]|nr:hypothetical protein IFM47457_07892 [Aspergillus lentulus]
MDLWAVMMMNEPFYKFVTPSPFGWIFSSPISLGSKDWPADMGSSGLENWLDLRRGFSTSALTTIYPSQDCWFLGHAVLLQPHCFLFYL